MKFPFSWLREFVDVPGTPQDVARTMSTRGFAVEGVESMGGDTVLDFEITANRPDCLSVLGMAREIAAAFDLDLRESAAAEAPPTSVDTSDIDIVIENPDLCPRYAGAVAHVKMGASPPWMQSRLEAAGVRPISNIVDITNYVLLELGHPMHAFDLARLDGAKIRVRTAKPGEALRTLDGRMRELDPDMLVIADARRPVAIAGVMGGADSEVGKSTTAIVFESAYFSPRSVRRTSKKLGLKTEASIRFERGADPSQPVAAMRRACALLDLTGSGRASGSVIDRYPRVVEPASVQLRREKIAGLLGTAIPDADVRRILESLGFELREIDGGWNVTVPTRRIDVAREVDLIEEAARHYGFDRLPVTFPALIAAPPPVDPRITRARHLRHILTAEGFSEAVTFGFMAEAAAAPFAGNGAMVPIANPLSETFAVLRPSSLPTLLDAVAHNRRREQRDVRLFEIGARFSAGAGETRSVACVWTGTAIGQHWSAEEREVDFFDMKGLVERICEGLMAETRIEPTTEPWLVRGRSASIWTNGGGVGLFGQLTAELAEKHGLPGGDAIYVAELDLDALERSAKSRVLRVDPLPRFPSITRDISILVDDSLAASEIRETIRGAASAALAQVREFDRYQGKGVPQGKVSLSLRLTFRSADRTLTDAEVQASMDAVLAALKARHSAVQR